jgi:hypothetical protein
VHPLEQDELEPAAVVILSMNKAACVVADEMYVGLRNLAVVPDGTAIVSVPVAAREIGGILFATATACGGVLFDPAREQARSTAAVKMDSASVRGFINMTAGE